MLQPDLSDDEQNAYVDSMGFIAVYFYNIVPLKANKSKKSKKHKSEKKSRRNRASSEYMNNDSFLYVLIVLYAFI